MATVRYLVKDVDAALPFYAALGFRVKANGMRRVPRQGVSLPASGRRRSA